MNLRLTRQLLAQTGVESSFKGNLIRVKPTTPNPQPTTIVVESDWTSASYFYSIVALSPVGTHITLSDYKEQSFQGDSALAGIYREFGVSTEYKDGAIHLTRQNFKPDTRPIAELAKQTLNLKLNDTPDIAQTIAVTCFGLGLGCHLTGLHTLKIKETDRLEALKAELNKFGAEVTVTNDSLTLAPHNLFGLTPGPSPKERGEAVRVATYNDHRMAMAFAPLALKTPFIIEDVGVVSKSFPMFWEDLNVLGFTLKQFNI